VSGFEEDEDDDEGEDYDDEVLGKIPDGKYSDFSVS
tara:strand:- start:338 stop:445 length:108 start_codon:yes stop_codon:yes gene_type:complete